MRRMLKSMRSCARAILWVSLGVALAIPVVSGNEQGAGAAPSPRAIEAIRLLQSSDPYERQLGFLRLEALREPNTVDAIQKYVESKDPDMRAYSLRAMAAIEGPTAVPLLLKMLKEDAHPVVRRAALLGLEPLQQYRPDMLPALIMALRDRNPEVRMTAVDIVSRVNHPRAKEAILLQNRRERDRSVRRALSLAMKRLGT